MFHQLTFIGKHHHPSHHHHYHDDSHGDGLGGGGDSSCGESVVSAIRGTVLSRQSHETMLCGSRDYFLA
jgi:hypothetical protein